jgi:putative transposase
MAIRRIPLVNNEIYHIVVRGVGNSLIFKNEKDRFRAIFSLYEFNDKKHVDIRSRRENQRKKRINEGPSFVNSNKRDLIVEILAFCFMPNHIHLLLKQITDQGISLFMRKFGTGYASYFNKKYKRQGYLFQGRFRSVHINNNNQLGVVFSYIHTNPASLATLGWKKSGNKNSIEVIKFLENYKWSSYLDYIGKNNFPTITERGFLSEVMGGKKGCINFVNDWIKYKEEINKFSDILIE